MSSDSEIALAFKERKEASKVKKQRNQEYSTETLKSAGIEFESHNWGDHIVINTQKGKIDFWPSTGKFIIRNSGRHGRGLGKILRMCGDDKPSNLVQDGIPSFYVPELGGMPCTHRTSDSDIPVWVGSGEDALKVIDIIMRGQDAINALNKNQPTRSGE